MKTLIQTSTLLAAVAFGGASAQDWPMWGGSPDRNMVGKATGIPTDIVVAEADDETEEVALKDCKNIRWVAKLGSQTYGNATVGFGKVFVGTNNESPRDAKQEGDRGVLMCFDEKTGAFLWQLLVPKLGAGKVSDWEYVGLCSSPVIEEDRLWVVTNRGEVLCLDIDGLKDGNDGPFKDEATYMSASKEGVPVELGDQHADILWRFDMRKDLGVFPHNVSSCSPLVVGDVVYTATSNGVDWSHTNIPAPLAPSLAALNKNSGKLLGEEISGVSGRVLHASWSSAAHGKIGGKDLLVWGGGDGFAYGFEPKPVMDAQEGLPILKEIWRYDCNPPRYRNKDDGEPIKYATFKGPSEVIGTTVIAGDRVYAIIGQDPEHGDGLGMLSCIDATKTGDLSGKAVWTYDKVGRAISTPSIVDGLVFQAEYDGDLHCLDAKNREAFWVYATQSRVWASTLVADGKVFLGTEDGDVHILDASRKTAERYGAEMAALKGKLDSQLEDEKIDSMEHSKQLDEARKRLLGIHTIEFGGQIYSSPVVANNVLYITSMTHLYAVGTK